jgi:hypothetical protein
MSKRPKRPLLDKKSAFLIAFVKTGSIEAAARAVQAVRSLHYRWLKDPSYRERFEAAKVEAHARFSASAVESVQSADTATKGTLLNLKKCLAEVEERLERRLKVYINDRIAEATGGDSRNTRKRRSLVEIEDRLRGYIRHEISELKITSTRSYRARNAAKSEFDEDDEQRLLNKIAREGLFKVKYKDFDSAPPAAQRTIRAIAKSLGDA